MTEITDPDGGIVARHVRVQIMSVAGKPSGTVVSVWTAINGSDYALVETPGVSGRVSQRRYAVKNLRVLPS